MFSGRRPSGTHRRNTVLAACSGGLGLLLILMGEARADGPTLHSNRELYRVRNPPATGRSGNASITARALMNKDGTTDMEVTTGELDSLVPAPGNIAKLQVKTYNRSGDVQWTKNYAGLTGGGTVLYNVPDLHRGQPIETQANITEIDRRTDVVTVSDNVKLRPDPAVTEVTSPSQASLAGVVNITATLTEKNGDVGARGDCTLWVDGAQADQAIGVYVDAGSTVTCAFSHTFNTTGSHSLEVRFSQSAPGDWDAANNSAQTTIEVLPTLPFRYSAFADSSVVYRSTTSYGSYQFSDGTAGSDWSHTMADESIRTHASISGSSPASMTFPLAHIEATIRADGNVVHSMSRDTVDALTSWGDASYGGARTSFFDPATSSNFYLDTSRWGDTGNTTTGYFHSAGEATFYSYGYQRNWNGYGGSTSTWSRSSPMGSYGTLWSMENTAAFDLSVTDANGRQISASPTVQLRSYSSPDFDQTICSTRSWPWGNEEWCSKISYRERGVRGFTGGVSNP